MRKVLLVVFCLALAGCTLLKINEEAEQQSKKKGSPQAAHLQ